MAKCLALLRSKRAALWRAAPRSGAGKAPVLMHRRMIGLGYSSVTGSTSIVQPWGRVGGRSGRGSVARSTSCQR